MAFEYPLDGEKLNVTSEFGPRWGRNHKGVDLKAKSGTRVKSVEEGTVVKAGNFNDGYGGQVLIRHKTPEGTFFTRYAHLRKWYVVANEQVKKGERIGESGGEKDDPNAGKSTGPHLHFEVMDAGGIQKDPLPFLKGTSLAAMGMADTSSKEDEKEDEKKKKIKTSEPNIVRNIMGKITSVYGPAAALAALGAGPKTESEEEEKLMEDIQRIKQLLK